MEVYYYTDPACPWSWALEPGLRRLMSGFGTELKVTYVMGGMSREFGEPLGLIAEALEASGTSGMPVDARLWLDAPPRSSYPACIAVKAAAEQGDPGPYLRRLREGFMCRRRKLDTTDALLEEARGLLDVERFRIALGSHATLEEFASDLERSGECPSPTFELSDGRRFAGSDRFPELAAALGAVGDPQPPSVLEALQRFGSMATPEVAAVCELPGPRAPAELWRLASEWTVKAERVGSGELWSLA